MKIYCEVQVLNRIAGVNSSSRSQKSTLAIGTTPKDESQIFILHFTNTNKTGTRYNLKDNLENVFCKFINEGKATIRFKTPPQDLCIKCDPTQLKGFLKTLKCSLSGEVPRKELALSNLTATSITKKMQPVTKLNIISRAQYPTKGFPRTLESLSISGIGLERFGTQILQLRNLRKLDLSKNNLKGIPPGVGDMPHLAELNLSENNLYESKLHEWEWISGEGVRNSLRNLNLSHNRLVVLPDNIVQLHGLIKLVVNNNKLEMLPNGVSRLRNLRSLFINQNNLSFLPYSIYLLRLMELDVSYNSFKLRKHVIFSEKNTMNLVELSARAVLKYNIKYSPSVIPKNMCRYLDASTKCKCSKSIVDRYSSYVILIDKAISESFVTDRYQLERNMPVKVDICSKKCFNSYLSPQDQSLDM